MTENALENLLEKCDIYYGDSLISKEDILRRYIQFLADSLLVQDRSISFALHTGSVCFDIISIIAVSLGVYTYNLNTNDDILAALNIGDMVMFQNERYHWKGTRIIGEEVYIDLEQDGRGRNGKLLRSIPYERNRHTIRPYYGTSSRTDGRGVRHKKTNREDFFSYVYDISISDVPVEIDTSVVVVADRARFSDICRNLRIEYRDGKQIGLLDLIPASYYTSSGSASQFGTNPTKAEAVLKVAGKIETARDLALDRTSGKKVVGLLISGITSLVDNRTELEDLLRRKSLRFVHIASPVRAELCEDILNLYSDSSVFACTREFLSQSVTRRTCHNALTDELYRQVANILHNKVITVNIGGGMGWDKYRQLKSKLVLLKQSNWANDRKEDFILSAYTLLNILITAPFSMDFLEETIRSGKIHSAVISPYTRIQSLRKISGTAGLMKETCDQIVNDLELQYNNLKTASPKGDFMRQRIETHKGTNIAIVFPKAYYTDVIMNMPWFVNLPKPKPKLTTVNRFNIADEYDYILVVGDIGSKRFNALQCYSAKIIDVLLYDCEGVTFRHRQYKAEKLSRQLNRHIGVQKGEVYEEAQDKDIENPEKIDMIISEASDLDQYIENIGSFDIKKLVSSVMDGGVKDAVSEVRYVGVFTTGERILFSKFYSPIVFDANAGTVSETSVEKLSPGDLLVFTKRNDYTHNIVDYIYDRLISLRRLNKQIIDATEKAFYWKEALRKYKEKNGYTYQMLAHKLKECGSSLTAVTVRQWLTEDGHIVGPRDEKTFEQIASMTQDLYLMKDPHSYYEGCRIVRRERREILGLIAKAINDKLSGHVPAAGSIFEVVYDNVENLSEIMEIDSILRLDEVMSIPINFVNRPIGESEG